MDDLGIGSRAEHLRDPLRPEAGDPPEVGGGVVDEPPGEDLAAVVGEGHHVTRGKVAVEGADAGGEQAAASRDDGLPRTGIDDDGSAGVGGPAEPALPGWHCLGPAREQRPDRLAAADCLDHAIIAAGCHDAVSASFRDDPGGPDLARHSPLREAAEGVLRQAGHRGIDARHVRHDRGTGLRGMAVEEALHVGEQHQQGRPKNGGNQRREAVVVTERSPQLLHAHRVVLVDDRHGTEVEEGEQRRPDVEVAGAVLEVVSNQQHLGHVAAPVAEGSLVGLDQATLADRRHRLQLRQFGRPLCESEAAHTGPNRARTHEHNPTSRRSDRVDLPPQ